jgi:HEAT repeat protein
MRQGYYIVLLALFQIVVIHSLCAQDNEIVKLIQKLSEDDRSEAKKLLIQMGKKAIPHLISALQSPNVELRRSVSWVLEDIKKEDSQTVIPHLINALKDQDEYVRSSAAEALGNTQGILALPYLLLCLKDKESVVREVVIRIFGNLKAQETIPYVIKALCDPDGDVRWQAMKALAEINTEECIPPLISILKNDKVSHYEKYVVCSNLLTMGAKIIPYLMDSFKDLDGMEKTYFHLGIRREIGKKAVPYLINAAKHPDKSIRSTAINILSGIGDASDIAHVSHALKDKDKDVREAALFAFLGSEQKAKIAMPNLIELLHDTEIDVWPKIWLIGGLGHMKVVMAVPNLILLLKDPHPLIRGFAGGALGGIGDKRAYEPLHKALKEEKEEKVRKAWQEALNKLK